MQSTLKKKFIKGFSAPTGAGFICDWGRHEEGDRREWVPGGRGIERKAVEGSNFFSSFQSLSHIWLFATPWTAAHQASLSITNSQTQTHVHYVSDAIQPSHPLSSPSPPTFNLSQLQGLFRWVTSSNQVAKAGVSTSTSLLPMNTQDWSPLGWTGWISLQSKGLSRVFFNTTVQKHKFSKAQLSL